MQQVNSPARRPHSPINQNKLNIAQHTATSNSLSLFQQSNMSSCSSSRCDAQDCTSLVRNHEWSTLYKLAQQKKFTPTKLSNELYQCRQEDLNKTDKHGMTVLLLIIKIATDIKDKECDFLKIISFIISQSTPQTINQISNNNDSALHAILYLTKHEKSANDLNKDELIKTSSRIIQRTTSNAVFNLVSENYDEQSDIDKTPLGMTITTDNSLLPLALKLIPVSYLIINCIDRGDTHLLRALLFQPELAHIMIPLCSKECINSIYISDNNEFDSINLNRYTALGIALYHQFKDIALVLIPLTDAHVISTVLHINEGRTAITLAVEYEYYDLESLMQDKILIDFAQRQIPRNHVHDLCIKKISPEVYTPLQTIPEYNNFVEDCVDLKDVMMAIYAINEFIKQTPRVLKHTPNNGPLRSVEEAVFFAEEYLHETEGE